jgi:hypothetical protein
VALPTSAVIAPSELSAGTCHNVQHANRSSCAAGPLEKMEIEMKAYTR